MKFFDPTLCTKKDVFLNNRNGDYFEVIDNNWVVAGNVGIHWTKAFGDETNYVKRS